MVLSIIAKESDLENNNYLSSGNIQKKSQDVKFFRPDGSAGIAKDVVIAKPGFINDFSMEYGAFEFTRDCNVRCNHCYVTANRINGHEPEYINLDFVIDLAHELKSSPEGRKRMICITGGEPTLDVGKLVARYSVLDELVPNKQIDIATNLLAIPCSSQGIGEFFSKFPNALIQASYSPYLEAQYTAVARKLAEGSEDAQKFAGKIPENVDPEYSLLEKIRLVDEYAHKFDKNFRIRVNGVNGDEMEKFMVKAKSFIGSKGRDDEDFIYSSRVVKVGNGKKLKKAAEVDEAAHECSHLEEIYMCSNGDLYPTVNHIDNVKNRIGTLVRLR